MFATDLLKDKVILVTGSAGGVGQATSRRLHRCGARLSLTSATAHRLAPLARELDAHACVADLRGADECARVVDAALRRHGRIDGVVSCAGAWTEGDSEAATEADWNRCIDLNLKATFFVCARAIPALKASRGAIVNVSSDAGLVGNARSAIYCASKGGVTLLSKSLAVELAPFGVRVNALCPADIMTPMLRRQASEYGGGDPQGYLSALLDRYLQGKDRARFIEPDEVACAIAYLLAPAAAPITGTALSMDFGLSAGY